MTREEAIDKISNYGNPAYNLTRDLILDIYREFNSRTCGNCKHWSMEFTNLGLCLKEVDTENIEDLSDWCTVGDFGCKRWESRDENK